MYIICISGLISAIIILLFFLLRIIVTITVKYQSTDWFVPMSCMYDVKCKHDQAQLLLLKDVMTKSCKEILIHCSFFTLSLSKTNGRQFSWSLLLQTIENVRLYFHLKIKYIKMT